MLENELDIKDIQQGSFNIKNFLFRALRYWYIILFFVATALVIAYYINLRAEKQYRLDTLITVKEEQNPFFTSTLNLTFNWGGASDKVETIRTILSSRTHNEDVVKLLQLYIHYMEEGAFRLEDLHTNAPFVVDLNEALPQLINVPIRIEFKENNEFELSYELENEDVRLINYTKNEIERSRINTSYKESFKMNELIESSFINFKIGPREDMEPNPGDVFYIKFTSIDEELVKFQRVSVTLRTKGASMLALNIVGTNRAILADYLNATVDLLSIKQLEQKNLFATNTIKFIDERIKGVSDSLKVDEDRLKDFRQENQIFDLSTQGASLFDRMSELDAAKSAVEIKQAYLNQLDNYLKNSTEYSDLPAPAASGLDDPSLVKNITEIVNLSIQRSNLKTKVKNPLFYEQIDKQIDAIKNVLFESINSARAKNSVELDNLNGRIQRLNYEFAKLPAEEQQLFNIERSYKLSEAAYSTLLEKRSEAGIVQAANVSDIRVIDPAKDLGQSPIFPNTKQNYLMALFAGLLIPLSVILIISFLDHNVNAPKDIEQLSSIPLLGVVGRNRGLNNLAVYEKPRSAVSEAFRALRSSLQFIYRSQSIKGSKTVMVTSSISGEGKTFCSINIASVFALSSKKTVLVGLDLRKPKIFEDFDITNDFGTVNYLIGQNKLDDIIQKTRFEYLDIITSGPIPPNPSELIISERMKEFIAELKKKYDYIILDTPPLGLVADAVELVEYADASLYIIRQGKTKKGMLNFINDKYKKGEIKNLSFVLNDYRHKSQYAYGNSYGYGYGYGYGGYSNGYHEDDKPRSLFKRLSTIFRKKRKY
ncbi:polysaccharide biosynthesis tyrosine autokinase [Leptobacterium flavescens]|uniref:non-specific protein-tyrosine kinase n=1 Tax=Leptobacterium flavescens TaxID=472055 RepID=A0A6P0UJZ0_9FLAO|nr:tyrosine-protein kinase [Leptobacterium flavescens]NER12189.1 polysaccharide biosynthesis tyrosine autokinase [Leptobacterium flavescens]